MIAFMVASQERTRRAGCGSRRGVTLIELLIVIVLIGILSGIAASRLRLDAATGRDAASRGVMADLALAQRRSVSLQEDVRISVPDSARMRSTKTPTTTTWSKPGAGGYDRLDNNFYLRQGSAPPTFLRG